MRRTKQIPPSDNGTPPSASDLRLLLGDAYEAFHTLVTRSDGCVAEWRRRSAESPWTMKVSEGPRALFYARPEPGAVAVTVLLGPRATEAALSGRVSKRLHSAIRTARVYAEGRPVEVPVRSVQDVAGVEELIAVKRQPVPTSTERRARAVPSGKPKASAARPARRVPRNKP